MPNLSFKPQFEPRIKSGAKRHSIRGKRKRPWRDGDSLYLWVSLRTKSRRFIGYSTVKMIEDILIDLSVEFGRLDITIEGRLLTASEADSLAQADGFATMREMHDFWQEHNEMPFEGDLIHWRFPFEARPKKPRLIRRRKS